jgi:hypothetical protein
VRKNFTLTYETPLHIMQILHSIEQQTDTPTSTELRDRMCEYLCDTIQVTFSLDTKSGHIQYESVELCCE